MKAVLRRSGKLSVLVQLQDPGKKNCLLSLPTGRTIRFVTHKISSIDSVPDSRIKLTNLHVECFISTQKVTSTLKSWLKLRSHVSARLAQNYFVSFCWVWQLPRHEKRELKNHDEVHDDDVC